MSEVLHYHFLLWNCSRATQVSVVVVFACLLVGLGFGFFFVVLVFCFLVVLVFRRRFILVSVAAAFSLKHTFNVVMLVPPFCEPKHYSLF